MHSKNFLHLLQGKRILVVEDEYFLADETRRKLEVLAAEVIGPVASVEDAIALIEAEIVDGAILDVYLGDEFVFPVTDKLEALDIPFVFATGYDQSVLPDRFPGFLLCEKPTELSNIARALFGDRNCDDLQ